MDIVAPKEWDGGLEALNQEKGIVILLGTTDAGKSTFAKFLISQLCKRRLRVALVDVDIGQSILAPPTTIGLAVFEPPLDHMGVSSSDIFFVGSTTPEGNNTLLLEGVKKMVDKAISRSPEVIVIDTTGFILGEAGREFKRRKIDLTAPRFIFALEKSEELEPILEMYGRNPLYRIYRFPISEGVRSRSREERTAYRAAKFKEYFQEAKVRKLKTPAIRLERRSVDANGFSIPQEWALGIRGLLVGLADIHSDTLALGIIISYDDEDRMLKVLTPLKDLKNVKSIQFSSLMLTPSYEEERF
jgi:polynucleotide 5'-kinase involved in rRNA processing